MISKQNSKISLHKMGFIHIKSNILQHQIVDFIENFDFLFAHETIDAVAIEDIFYAYNPKTLIKLAQFRGAISLKMLLEFGNFSEYTPLQIKKALTGNGKATKMQVAFMVRQILNLREDIRPYDVTDAIATAITHARFC